MINRRLLNSSASLITLQFFNYLAPIIILPYLTRILSIEEFGAVMLAMVAIGVANVITDYGYSFSATYRIAKNRRRKKYIEILAGRIFTSKLLLVFIASVLIYVYSLLPQNQDFKQLYWLGLGAIVSYAFQPTWIFQGLEMMKQFTIVNALVKLFHIVIVLLLVKKEGDGIFVILSWSIVNFIGTMTALFMITKIGYKVSFSKFDVSIKELKQSADFFWTRLSVLTYTSLSSMVVGTISLHQAALYSVGYQGYRAGNSVTGAIVQAMFPFMVQEKNWRSFRNLLALTTAILLITIAVSFYYIDLFIILIFGEQYLDAELIVKIFMLTLILNFLSSSFGYPVFAALECIENANKTIHIGAIFFVFTLSIIWLTDNLSAVSVALLILITETIVFTYRILLFLKIRK